MRFLKIYFGTLIIILIIAIFLYAMSFVYIQSVEASAGVNVPMLETDRQGKAVVFSVMGRDIYIDKEHIDKKISKTVSYLPVEFSELYKALAYTENQAAKLYNKLITG